MYLLIKNSFGTIIFIWLVQKHVLWYKNTFQCFWSVQERCNSSAYTLKLHLVCMIQKDFFSCQQWEKSWEWWLACTWHIAWVRPMRYMDSVHRHLVCRMMRGGLEVARVASQAWDTGRHPCSTPVTGPHTATWSWAHTATTGDMSNTCNTHWLANWTGTRLGKHLAEYEVTVVLPGHLLWLLLLL